MVPWRGLAALLACLTLVLVDLGWGVSLSSFECALLDTLVGATTAAALVVMALRPAGALHRLFSVGPLVKVGGFSYSLYLVHAPLQHVIWLYALTPLGLPPAGTFALLVVIGVPVLVGAAYLFYRVFERPFMPGSEGSIWGRILPGPPSAAAPR